MERFSQRMGLEPKKQIQVDDMDDRLRNRLWNQVYTHSAFEAKKSMGGAIYLSDNNEIRILCERIWDGFLGGALDELSDDYYGVMRNIKDSYSTFKWNKVYDFIEFVANNSLDQVLSRIFVNACNIVLKEEVSGYRFVKNKKDQDIIAPITSEVEIEEIERALSSPLNTVNEHIRAALGLFADRESPDYRNSIKESISAVEATCRVIAKNDKATLGQALDEIEKKKTVKLHPALKEAFSKMYGYTSDEGGIRHAMIEVSEIDSEDARYMLVSCSAFVNYLIEKARKAGIDLG